MKFNGPNIVPWSIATIDLETNFIWLEKRYIGTCLFFERLTIHKKIYSYEKCMEHRKKFVLIMSSNVPFCGFRCYIRLLLASSTSNAVCPYRFFNQIPIFFYFLVVCVCANDIPRSWFHRLFRYIVIFSHFSRKNVPICFVMNVFTECRAHFFSSVGPVM